jgi:CMP/dCMP kinase
VTIVAIDGPAGAGKSSTARGVARTLGWDYVDTGAMYRAVALAARQRAIDPEDGPALGALAASLRIAPQADRMIVDGADVTDRLRSPEVTDTVSAVSAHAEVRAVMSRLQRALAASRDVVMEGRDIGTSIAPHAEVKVYLTASLATRARRRCHQLGLRCDPETLADLESSLAERDRRDSSRAESPLSASPTAVVIDSTEHDLAAIVATIVDLVGSTRVGG